MEIVKFTLKEIIGNEYCRRIIITLIAISLFQTLTPESFIQKLMLSGIYLKVGFLLVIYLVYNYLKAIYTLTTPTREEWEIEFKSFVLNAVKYSFAASLFGFLPFLLIIIYLKDFDSVIHFFSTNDLYKMCISSLIQFFVTIGFGVSVALRTNKDIFSNIYTVITVQETNNVIVIGFIIEVFNLILSFLTKDLNNIFISLGYFIIIVEIVYFLILVKRIQFIKPIL